MADPTHSSEPTDPQWLMESLQQRTDELANQAYDRFVRVIPDARQWTDEQKHTFIGQAKSRFDAILSVMTQGTQVDNALRRDLEEVGSSAAWAGTSLPHLLLVLRISRDLLLQFALRLADQRGASLNASLGAFSARMLPAIDRLTDALSDGFWGAKLDQQQEEWHRLANLVEASPYGVYEADLDGNLRFSNPSFALLVGERPGTLFGRSVLDLVRKGDDSSISALINEPAKGVDHIEVEIRTPEGAQLVAIDTVVRKVNDKVVGFGGIIRRKDAVGNAAPVDTSSMVPEVEELRRSLGMLGEAGKFLEMHAERMTHDRVAQAGVSITRQSKRMVNIVEQLDQARKNL